MWATDYKTVYSDHAIKVLEFKKGKTENSILIVPPQAGHHSYIADYDKGQSIVESAMKNSDHSVYCIEWLSCTFERRNEGIEDLVSQVDSAVDIVDGKPYLVGLCQGGWLTAIYAAMYPDKLSESGISIAGAPIDTHAGDSVLKQLIAMPLYWYQYMVMMSGGLMRGDMMLAGWKGLNPVKHYFERYTKNQDSTEKFYRWYDLTQNLAGRWYLWAINQHFKQNLLGQNRLTIGQTDVDLTKIRGDVTVVVGTKDDITPREQTEAIHGYCSGKVHEIDAGHIGVFMSSKGMKTWASIFNFI